jgi:hypothetical protein
VLFDFIGDTARSALKLVGGAEHEVEQHSPVEAPLKEAIAALHHAAESMDRHVEVLEAVAATLPELTGALVKLTEQLGEVLHMAAPLEAAEREVAGLGHLFRRRHRGDGGPAVAAAQYEPPLVGDGQAGEGTNAAAAGSDGEREDGAAAPAPPSS